MKVSVLKRNQPLALLAVATIASLSLLAPNVSAQIPSNDALSTFMSLYKMFSASLLQGDGVSSASQFWGVPNDKQNFGIYASDYSNGFGYDVGMTFDATAGYDLPMYSTPTSYFPPIPAFLVAEPQLNFLLGGR